MPDASPDDGRGAREHAPRPHASRGNRLRLFPSGDRSFEAMVADIDRAERRVWLETYIFLPDATGRDILAALVRAARRGCDVILMIDRFGAKALRDRHVRSLREAGGHAYWFNPFFGLRAHATKVTPFGVHRDHRKILVIDEAVAYTGGRNVSVDYGGRRRKHARFFDLMVRVEGPAAHDFGAVFLETLSDTTDLRRDLFDPVAGHGDAAVRVLQLDLREHVGALDYALCDLAAHAREQLLFCTPYLLPPTPILRALTAAAERGVDVRILTAGESDVPWVKYAGRHLYARLLAAGARIFEHRQSTLHAKFYVADGRRSIVGSYNADRWGQRFNQEVAAEVESTAFAAELAECFEAAVEGGVEVTRAMVARRRLPARAAYAALYGFSWLVAPDASRVRREVPAWEGPEGERHTMEEASAESEQT